MSPISSLSTEWRVAFVGAAVGVVLVVPTLLLAEQEGPPLLVAGVVAGFLAPRSANAYVAGARAGLVTSVPLGALFLFENTAWFALQESTAFAVGASVLITAFVLGLGYFAGGIGAGIGGWLAVQFGRKEPA